MLFRSIWSWKQKVGVGEGITRSVKKGQLVCGVAMEKGPIDSVPTDIGIGHESTQTGTQFPQKSDDLGMPLWTL